MNVFIIFASSYNGLYSMFPNFLTTIVLLMFFHLVFSKGCLVCIYVECVSRSISIATFAFYVSNNVYFVLHMFVSFFPGVMKLSSFKYKVLYDLSTVFYVFEQLDNG